MTKVYYANTDSSPHLSHHGIKGMHWGVRRYQNADGSLTEAGKRRQHKQVLKQRRYDHKYRAILTDKELNSKIQRLEREKQYSNLYTGPAKQTSGPSKAIKTAVGITLTAAAVATAAFIVRSRIMKMGVSSLTNKTISIGRNIVNKQLARNATKPKSYAKWLKIQKIGRVGAKDLRSIDLSKVAAVIRVKK